MAKTQDVYARIKKSTENEDVRFEFLNNHKRTLKKLKEKRQFKPYDNILKIIKKLKRSYYLAEMPKNGKSFCIMVLDKHFNPVGQVVILPAEMFNSNVFDEKHYTLNIDINHMISYEAQDDFLNTLTTLADKYDVSLHAWVGHSGNTKTLYEKYEFNYTGYKANAGQIKLYTNHK